MQRAVVASDGVKPDAYIDKSDYSFSAIHIPEQTRRMLLDSGD